MRAEATKIKDCYIIHDSVFEDPRGYFFESFNKEKFTKETGLDVSFVQDNQSRSTYGVLRGLHFQRGKWAQAKLVRVIQGRVLDVVVDLRKESPTFGEYVSIELSEDSRTQFFVPRGLAHGFVVLSEHCVFFYKCDNYYNKQSEGGLLYNDPYLKIDWKIGSEHIVLSDKDKTNPTLNQLTEFF